ncbi:MAG: HAMP domain-containing protein [Oscillospiraceae bacterium]|nr:HAMP domain-containing protein [Oscillospiraceae bacterium]
MKKRTGIQKRWMFNNLSIVILLVLAVVVAFPLAFTMYYYSNMQSGLEAKAKTTTDFFGNYLGQSYNEYYQSCINVAHNFEDKNTLELQFISPSGRLVASSYGQWAGKGPGTSDVDAAIETKRLAIFNGTNPATGERIMAVSSPMIYTNGEVIGVLRYVTSLKNVGRQILMLTAVTVVVGVLFILLIMYNSRYFIRSIIEPVSEITETAKRISAGGYGVQIKKKFDDEIGELTDTINDMSVKLGQAERMQSEFVSSVSHELRTPLTAISGWGETILSAETMDPVETRRGMVIILRETRRLTDMVEELLEFTRMQDGRFTLNVEPADLQAEFEDTVFMYGSRLKQEGIELVYLENDDVLPEIPCDISRMRQVFLNILDNAAKHGGEGRRITAEIRQEGEYAAVRIRDFGPGIPEDELPHVKMKFYKGSTKARGSGIGLAVCEEIVTMHGGQLVLSNAEGGGTLVTIRLPIGEGA